MFPVSAASGEGTRQLIFAMSEIVLGARAEREVAVPERIIIRPPSADGGDDFTVTKTGEGWRVRGVKPERWVRQTDFSNDEAVGFLADRLNRLGVEAKLLQLGAEEGDAVLIGHPDDAVVFDFKPGIDAGAEILSRRGEDQRFEEQRPAARRRQRDRRGDARARRGRDPRRRGPPARPSREARSDRLRGRVGRRPRLGRVGPRRMTTTGERRTGGVTEARRASWSRSARRR